MTVSDDLDRTFREAAAAAGLIDAAYDLADSPLGTLLVATTDRGLCQISFDPDRGLDELSESFGRQGREAARGTGGRRRDALEPDPDRPALPPRDRREREPDRLRRRARAQARSPPARGRDSRLAGYGAARYAQRRRSPGSGEGPSFTTTWLPPLTPTSLPTAGGSPARLRSA